jgi:hypothetical protein
LIRLGEDEGVGGLIGSPFAPAGGETRVPSLTLPLPPELLPAEPDDPPDDVELLDDVVPPRGPACAHAVTGTPSANITAIDPNARIDLVMASAPPKAA